VKEKKRVGRGGGRRAAVYQEDVRNIAMNTNALYIWLTDCSRIDRKNANE
jgi:hypothetical protein